MSEFKKIRVAIVAEFEVRRGVTLETLEQVLSVKGSLPALEIRNYNATTFEIEELDYPEVNLEGIPS